MSSSRLDTRLESEGAEFLVLGELLIHKIAAYKTYKNMPHYDLVAINPETNRAAKIQVKSRWRTGALSFPINKFGCDFVVAAFLNRGSKDGKKNILPPTYYILPIAVIRDLPKSSGWSKVHLKKVSNLEFYRDNWALISGFLSVA